MDRAMFESLLHAGLAAADPAAAVTGAIDGSLHTAIESAERLVMIAIGKAAPAMASGAAAAIKRPFDACVIATHAVVPPLQAGCDIVLGDHPRPGARSLEAGRLVIDAIGDLGRDDFVLFLVSGGGSALVKSPVPGVGLDEFAQLVDRLDRAGATIHQINAVRARLSEIKGGGLAGRAAPAQFATLVVSDVPGDDISVVASGPTFPAPRPATAMRALHDHGIVPPDHLLAAIEGPRREVPAPLRAEVVASGLITARAIVASAAAAGVPARLVPEPMEGEAADVARRVLAAEERSGLGVYFGETTVTRRGPGRGGRNQEAALAAAIDIAGMTGVTFAAVATDGRDGPTDNSGGLVDGETYSGMVAGGVDPVAALAANDSATALEAAGAHLRSGPTGTNVGDIWMVHRA